MNKLTAHAPTSQINLSGSSSGPVLNRPNNPLLIDPTAPSQYDAIGPLRRVILLESNNEDGKLHPIIVCYTLQQQRHPPRVPPMLQLAPQRAAEIS